MEYYFAFVVAFFSTVTLSSSYDCREVIRLDFGPVRGNKTVPPPPLPLSAPPGGCPAPGEKNSVYCFDAHYPNDIFCDVGGLESHYGWNNTNGVANVELKYEHPSAEGTLCQVRFLAPGDAAKTLTFNGAECSTAVEDQEVPHFGVAKVTQMKITPRPLDPSLNNLFCTVRIYNMGGAKGQGVADGGAKREPEVFKFGLDKYVCLTYWPSIVHGRQPNKAYYANSGKRHRPTK